MAWSALLHNRHRPPAVHAVQQHLCSTTAKQPCLIQLHLRAQPSAPDHHSPSQKPLVTFNSPELFHYIFILRVLLCLFASCLLVTGLPNSLHHQPLKRPTPGLCSGGWTFLCAFSLMRRLLSLFHVSSQNNILWCTNINPVLCSTL